MANPSMLEKKPWHSIEITAATEALNSGRTGLSAQEAQARLQALGANRLPEKKSTPWWKFYLRQLRSPLIYILLLAAIFSLAIGETVDAGFIFAVIVLNGLIGGYQESRAEKSARALQKLLSIRATVLRDGETVEVDAEQLVPGDVVWLESGNRVPADLRLLMSLGVEVDESLLTGESLAVVKQHAWLGHESAPVAERQNMAHAGSIMVRGRAEGLVVATGSRTSVGQLAASVLGAQAVGRPPLLERLERFSKMIAIAVVAAAVVVGIVGVWVRDFSPGEMFLYAVALAVSAIPEGLPVSLTVALAVATTRMARRGVIVRSLTAVEGLGSCTYIASDKTGTLTVNELTVKEVRTADGQCFTVSGEGFAPEGAIEQDNHAEHRLLRQLVHAAIFCNEAELYQKNAGWRWRGDAVDIALLSLGHKLGANKQTLLAEHPAVNHIPFEPERQYAATYHQFGNQSGPEVHIFLKGAPERVLAMCGPGAAEHLKGAEELAERGYRVLAIARGVAPASMTSSSVPPEPQDLTFLGFVGMLDPLRAGVKGAVDDCHRAGMTVSMVTGDHPRTALAIACELGFADSMEQVVTGPALAAAEAAKKAALIAKARVFARVSPKQKLEIVDALRHAGHYVAVTGDGVNDAPALRTANIGVAMGRSGTDVAREASDLVITDDNFSTIIHGVEEGRIAYDNIRKVIFLLASTGAAEIVLLAGGLLLGLPLPLTAVQILWLNLVTNGIQDKALAFEPAEHGILNRPPRPPKERIFNRLMIERVVVSSVVIGVLGCGAFAWMLQAGLSEHAARNNLLLLMVLFENVHLGNCRSETHSAFVHSPLKSPFLLGGALLALLVHIVAMVTPFGQAVLGTSPTGFSTWAILALLALSVLVGNELHKWSWRRRYPGK